MVFCSGWEGVGVLALAAVAEMVFSVVVAVLFSAGAAGVGDGGRLAFGGRSRRLRHDSWNQSCNAQIDRVMTMVSISVV